MRPSAPGTGGAADFPFEVVQRVAEEQLRREPDNPAPYLAVATASLTHKRDYGLALDGLQAALRLLLERKYRILLDRAGTLTERRLADAYRLRAEIRLAQGNLPDALASLKASEGFARDSATAGHLLESRIWSALSDGRRADVAQLEVSRRGAPAPKRPFAFDVVSLDASSGRSPNSKGRRSP
jgi:hypothetical protein